MNAWYCEPQNIFSAALALFTLVLAIATIGLWWYNKKLWDTQNRTYDTQQKMLESQNKSLNSQLESLKRQEEYFKLSLIANISNGIYMQVPTGERTAETMFKPIKEAFPDLYLEILDWYKDTKHFKTYCRNT